MPYKFNPITGQLDLVNSSSGSSSVDMEVLSNKILTGPVLDLEREGVQSFDILFDQNGNVLVRE